MTGGIRAARLAGSQAAISVAALVQRKKEELTHPLLDQKVPIGLLPLLQARLLARHIRGELPAYPALVVK